MGLLERARQWFEPPAALKPGLYEFRTPADAPRRYRLHLRVEPSGNGTLIVNASTVLHLNRTATEYAVHLVNEASADAAAAAVSRKYRVSVETAREDYLGFSQLVHSLIDQEDACPVMTLELERIEPFQAPESAPYRADLALTYRCDNSCSHCYVGRDSNLPELDTAGWKQVIDRLWQAGVPHVCFTGGEATLREDLAELVLYAEDVGFVTGLLTNGRRLADSAYLDSLIVAGLDHVQITLESHDAAIHNEMVGAEAWHETVAAVRNAVAADLYTLTNTTLTKVNVGHIEQTIDFLASLGVTAFACNSIIRSGKGKQYELGIPEADLADVLHRIADAAERNSLRFIWYTPTQYCHLNPIELQLGVKGCTAARHNICVEPDATVIPCQSYYESMGNILEQEWSTIWNSELATKVRNRVHLDAKCVNCEQVSLCGGGCPLYASEPDDR